MKIKILNLKHLTILCTLHLAACMGVYDEDFDCGVGKGVGCRSISQVNEMVNRGQVPLPTAEDEEKEDRDESSTEDVELSTENLPVLAPLASEQGFKVKRIPEKTVRLWVAPHEAQDGSFVEETYVNLVIESGRWVNIPQGDL